MKNKTTQWTLRIMCLSLTFSFSWLNLCAQQTSLWPEQTGKNASSPSADNLIVCGTYTTGDFNTNKKIDVAPDCATTLSPSSSLIIIKSRTSIIFHPGFTALNGSNMHAFIDTSGNEQSIPPELFTDNIKQSDLILEGNQKETKIKLEVTPNPFSDFTEIFYELPDDEIISAELLNMQMQPVAILFAHQYKTEGQHTIQFSADNLSAGMYLLRLQSRTSFTLQKLLIQK